MSKTHKKDAAPSLAQRTWKEKFLYQKYVIISFFLPFLLLGIGFAVNQVFPFGDQQILVTDFWQQYYPFMCDFQSKLQEGSSLLYSWGTGLGTNYVALIAYYLASPLNFLMIFVPAEFLREAVTVFLLIKIGCAGMFMSILLRSLFKRNDFSIVFFSVLYALCSFVMGYYWNVIWFDTFALLPLVVFGTVALVTRGKYKLFVISLALSMLTNYYMGFFTCIFTAVVFFGVCISIKISLKNFFKKLLQIAAFSVIGLGISAVLILPAYIALQHTHSAVNTFPDFTALYDWQYTNVLNFISDILGNANAFVSPTEKEGLPNIYCGFICILLSVVYFRSKKIQFRDKVFNLAVLALLFYCCLFKLPNFIIHGLHLPNMLPYRFSYLISFILILMAYRAFLLLEDLKIGDIIGMAITSCIFIILAYFGPQEQIAVTGTTAIAIIYIALMLMYLLKIFPKSVLSVGIFTLILAEMCGSVFIGVETVRTTSRTGYPDQKEAVDYLKNNIEANDDEPFYRMELQHFYTINDPTIYGYKGAALFSSTVNESITKFVEGIGLIGWDAGNRYYYAETSPLTNMFLDIKYLIGRRTTAQDTNNWNLIESYNYANSYSNNRYLSMGFMTENSLKDFDYNTSSYGIPAASPFDAQQSLFEKSTGLTDQLFTPLEAVPEQQANVTVTSVSTNEYSYSASSSGTLKWNCTVPKDCSVYVYTKINNVDNITISNSTASTSYEVSRPYIISAGTYKAGETLSVSGNVTSGNSGTAKIYVCMLNQDVFDKGYELLKDELYNVETFETTNISGTVEAKKDGLLYMSIPYENGWTAYVDGVETEITPIADAMVSVPLTAGKHTVTFKYVPEGFIPGLTATILCIALFVIFAIFENRISKRNGEPVLGAYTNKIAEEAEALNEQKVNTKSKNKKGRKK